MNNDNALNNFSTPSALANWLGWLASDLESSTSWTEMCHGLAKRFDELTPEGRKKVLWFIAPTVDKDPENGTIMTLAVLIGYMYSKGEIE